MHDHFSIEPPLPHAMLSYVSHHRSRSRSGQPNSSSPYGLRYIPLGSQHLGDFPVSATYRCELEPDSHPIDHLHEHDLLEVGYCHAGAGILVVEDRVMTFEAGDVAVINDQEMHMSRGNQQNPSRWTYFWIDPAATLAGIPEALEVSDQAPLGGQGFPNIISCRTNPDICQLVQSIISELDGHGAHSRVIVRGLTAALMAHLHRLRPAAADKENHAPRTGVDRISAALQHMANHYHQEIEVEELADLCCLSVTHFRRVFLAATGQAPLTYLAQVRVRMAAAFLREQPDKPVTQVASEVGFDALNTFNRQFRRIIGTSPRQWRRQRADRVKEE